MKVAGVIIASLGVIALGTSAGHPIAAMGGIAGICVGFACLFGRRS